MEGLKKGVLKQKSLNMMQAVQRKPNKDPSWFLEKISQAYWKHTDADDPQASENVQMVNMTFMESAPEIRRKLQNLDKTLEVNLSQLVVWGHDEDGPLPQVTKGRSDSCWW